MNLKVLNTLKLTILANQTSSTLGPILGQYNINIMQFSKEVTQLTKQINLAIELPVILLIYHNTKYSFILKKPTLSFFFKKILIDINKAYGQNLEININLTKIISIKQIYELVLYQNKAFKINLKNNYKNIFGFISSTTINILI